MVTKPEVFDLLKEFSGRSGNHHMLLSDLSDESGINNGTLLMLLVELEMDDLVRIYKTQVLSVSFTNRGLSKKIRLPELAA